MRFRQRLLGLGAVLLLAAILLGLPVVLTALGGNPLPSQVPSLDQVRDALLTPDDGTLVLTTARLLGWVVWALLALTVLVELIAQARGIKAPHLPGLGMPQAVLRPLVATALALFVAVPTATVAAATPTTPAANPAVTTTMNLVTDTPPDQTVPAGGHDRSEPAPQGDRGQSHTVYVVQPGDTLWSIAQTHLGSGNAFGRIVAANPDQLSQGADWISPGMELRIPATAQTGQGTVTVVPGDTLSGLAARHLDDGDRWPELYEATAGLPQPDGRVLTDPDLIYPGWQVQIPGVEENAQEAAAQPAGDAAAQAGVTVGTVDPTEVPASNGASAPAAAAALSGADLGATPAPGPDSDPRVSAASEQSVSDGDHEHGEDGQDHLPGWVLPGLVGSGALLGGALFLAVAARRRAAFRHRRPGRGIAPPAPELVPVEKTIQSHGLPAAIALDHVDEVLRRLGGLRQRTDAPVPVLAAVQLDGDALTVHLSQPADLGAPWEGSEDHLHWRLAATVPLEEVGPLDVDGPAPYPLLVSIGTRHDGSNWLLNLEDLQVQITGDQVYYTEDLARFLAAEIAVNPWSSGVRLACVGVGEEVVAMNPARIHAAEPDAMEDLLAEAVAVVDRLGGVPDVPTARLRRAGEERWPAQMLMAHVEHATGPATELVRQLLADQPGRTSTALVIVGDQELHPDAVHIEVGADGSLHLPGPGLELVGVGLTPDEARGCAALLSQAGQPREVPMPVPGEADQATEPWRAWADQAGALRPEHTHGRQDQDEDSTTLLPEPDQDYIQAGATTAEDLETLSPKVAGETAARIVDADPDLDADLAAWWDPQARLPKLTLLGPVAAKTWGKPMADRRPYFTEMLAYLVLHPAGSTPGEVAEAFSITVDKCRGYIGRCREWLGNHPETGLLHLPHATDAPAAKTRGVNVYQVVDVLVDADLFRRLRARAEARGGEEGIADLRQALELVQGRPFDQLRQQGWGWLFEGDRLDQHMVCAIVDVAHIVTTHDLATDNLTGARAAAEVAALAGPDEEITALDGAAVLAAEGHTARAAQALKEIGNRNDDPDELPEDLPERTKQILDARSWLEQRPAG